MADPSEIKAKEVVTGTLTNLAKSKSIDMTKADAAEMKPEIIKEMASVIAFQTNQEPFYQSTVTVGAAITLIGGGYTFVYEIYMNGAPEPTTFVALVTPIVGALVTLWGRWVQKKPIGE